MGSPHVYTAWTTGNIGGTIDAPATVRISTPDGDINVPRGAGRRYETSYRTPRAESYRQEEIKKAEDKKKARAEKWKKWRNTIKRLLHRIKEKLKE